MRNGQMPQQQQTQYQQPQLNEEYIQQLKILMHSKNAEQYLAAIAMNNPQFKSILNMVKNGGNPQAIYEMLARQWGVDPNWLLNKLQG